MRSSRFLTLLILAVGSAGCTVDSFPAEPAVTALEQVPPVTPRGALSSNEQAIVDLFKRASPAVVYITTLSQRANFFTGMIQEVPRGTGTGFVWDLDGHIVTNFHVLQGGNRAQIVLADQSTHDAEFVGGSPQHDLAVLRINSTPELQQVAIGESETLRVGQSVYAIGNPFGLSATLSIGIISALDRRIQSVAGNPIEGVIQIDATINPGNSGGPLLDSAGRAIGVNTAIASTTGESAGIGFAIPIDTVRRVVPQLIATGKYESPHLGITSPRGLSAVVRRLGTTGVLVNLVEPGSGAAQAGIRPSQMRRNRLVPGDIVQAIDGDPVESLGELQTILDRYQVGDVVTVTLWRAGRTKQVRVRLS